MDDIKGNLQFSDDQKGLGDEKERKPSVKAVKK